MKIAKRLAVTGFCVLLLGCGKSSKLAGLLPDPPAGWSAEGSVTSNDVSGVGHSSARSYVPGNADGLGVKKVTVQILVGEKGADSKQLNGMSIEKAGFKEKKDLGGFTAYESFPLPDNDSHSLDINAQGRHVCSDRGLQGRRWMGQNRKPSCGCRSFR
jgi:hypothetical protein